MLNFEARMVEWVGSLGHVDLDLIGVLLRLPDDLSRYYATEQGYAATNPPG